MPLDRAKIKYLIEDLKTRPERMRAVQRLGVAFGFLMALLLVLWLSLGGPPPKPKTKNTAAAPPDPVTQGIRNAFDYAKAAQAILTRDARFSRVYFVPSAATPTQTVGKVVVMGEMASDADLEALQAELGKIGVAVPLEWQVSLNPPAGGSPLR